MPPHDQAAGADGDISGVQKRRQGGAGDADEEAEVERSNVALFWHLHKKTTKMELRKFCEGYGQVLSIHLWYGFGKAIVEMRTIDQVQAILNDHLDTPTIMRGKEVKVGFGIAPNDAQRAKEDVYNPMVIGKEVRRCVEDLIAIVEEKANRRKREELRMHHNALRKEVQADTERRECRTDVCWEWVTRRSCWRGDECPFLHIIVPVSDLPARFRWFIRKDNFPNSRQISPYKASMNALLASLADTVPNPTVLVLDGSSCNSVRCVTGGKFGRGPGDIFVPNNCTETFVKIKAEKLCTPFYGSVRALIDSDTSRRFGFLYLDYCCSLSAGRFHIEKSPVSDIEQLFHNRQIDEDGCVLCVCLATVDKSAKAGGEGGGSSSDDESGDEKDDGGDNEGAYTIPSIEEGRGQGDPQKLRCLVTSRAAAAGMVTVCFPTSFWWPGNYAEVFYIASPLKAAEYLAAPACPFFKFS